MRLRLGMAPKGSKPKSKQKSPQASARRQTVTAKPQNRSQNRRGSRRNPLWFPLISGTLQSTQPQGTLDVVWLHPQNFPNTPYSSACENFSNRRESYWEFRVEITTATTTGVRIAAVTITDPTFNGELDPPMVWSMLANGNGAMVTTQGSGRRHTLRPPRATLTLSNGPLPEGSKLGFSLGAFCLYCLDPPFGITTGSLNYTVLARVSVTGHGAAPGFLNWAATPVDPYNPTPPPHPTPGQTIDWQMIITPGGSDRNGFPHQWTIPHSGGAWLAGGVYLGFPNPGGAPPTYNNKVPPSDEGQGQAYLATPTPTGPGPLIGAVYTSTTQFGTWQASYGLHAQPTYFAVFWHPSGFVYLIGFQDFEDAKNQAIGNTGAVRRNSELAPRYSGTIYIDNIFGHGAPSTGNITVSFCLAWKSPQATPVYKGTFTTLTGDSVAPMSLALQDNLPPWANQPATQEASALTSPASAEAHSLNWRTYNPSSQPSSLMVRPPTHSSQQQTSGSETSPPSPPLTTPNNSEQSQISPAEPLLNPQAMGTMLDLLTRQFSQMLQNLGSFSNLPNPPTASSQHSQSTSESPESLIDFDSEPEPPSDDSEVD